MRSCDIAARCREIALRVDASGEWGELGDTLREAATEVERLRLLPSVEEEIVAWSVDLHDAREEIRRLKGEVERLRLTPDEREFLALLAKHQPVAGDRETLLLIVKRLGGAE